MKSYLKSSKPFSELPGGRSHNPGLIWAPWRRWDGWLTAWRPVAPVNSTFESTTEKNCKGSTFLDILTPTEWTSEEVKWKLLLWCARRGERAHHQWRTTGEASPHNLLRKILGALWVLPQSSLSRLFCGIAFYLLFHFQNLLPINFILMLVSGMLKYCKFAFLGFKTKFTASEICF